MAVRLAVLVSASGTTLQNLIDRIADGRLDVQIALVISSRADALGLERAKRANIPTNVEVLGERSVIDFSAAIFAHISAADVDLVVLAGFLKHLHIPERYADRVINIHPSLLPAFGGKGFYGERVHRAVLQRGCKLSGCTVHFANPHFDEGPIISQTAVPVLDGDTPATLAARVFAAECEALPEAIMLWAAGRLKIVDGRVHHLPPSNS